MRISKKDIIVNRISIKWDACTRKSDQTIFFQAAV